MLLRSTGQRCFFPRSQEVLQFGGQVADFPQGGHGGLGRDRDAGAVGMAGWLLAVQEDGGAGLL